MADEVWSARIDFNGDGDWLDANEDVSADLLSLDFGAGRNSATGEFAAGDCTLVLENATGVYSRYNATSPIYGLMKPGRELVLQAVHTATYPAFRGTLVEMAEAVSIEGIPTVSLHFVDAFEQLRLGLTNTALLETKRVDEVITAVLDDISWPAGRRTLDTAVETLTVFTNHNRLPVNALQLAAKQDLPGYTFIGKDGNVVFQNRDHRGLAPLSWTVTDMAGISLAFRQDDIIEKVRSEYARLVVGAAVEPVWSLTLPRRLTPGTGSFDFDVNAAEVLGAKGYVTPLVATTDFVANSASDGSGTSKTAQVSLTVSASSSGGGTISWVNLDSSDVYLTFQQVRAYAMKAGGETNVARATAASPVVAGQTLNETFEFNDNGDAVQGYANWRAATLSQDQPRPVIQLVGHTDAEIDMILGAGIGDKVLLQNTTGLYPTNVNGYFFIEAYRVSKQVDADVTATWTLFSQDYVGGSVFRVSDDTPGGASEYGVIAADAATSGDRIGY